MNYRFDYVTLVICDDTFHRDVKDLEAYQNKLFNFIRNKKADKEVTIKTVSGKYSFRCGLEELYVDSKNKTLFNRSFAAHFTKIDDVVIISNFEQDQQLNSLKELLNKNDIPLTLFSYETKINDSCKA